MLVCSLFSLNADMNDGVNTFMFMLINVQHKFKQDNVK